MKRYTKLRWENKVKKTEGLVHEASTLWSPVNCSRSYPKVRRDGIVASGVVLPYTTPDEMDSTLTNVTVKSIYHPHSRT